MEPTRAITYGIQMLNQCRRGNAKNNLTNYEVKNGAIHEFLYFQIISHEDVYNLIIATHIDIHLVR